MTGFEHQISGVEKDCSANWATTTVQIIEMLRHKNLGARCVTQAIASFFLYRLYGYDLLIACLSYVVFTYKIN